jgi:hypothetical protein
MNKDFETFNKIYTSLLAFYSPALAYRLAVEEMNRRK